MIWKVLNGQLTLGQLIAFRIISGFVTQPILRLTNLWQSVQELKVGFERLGDVINTNTESDEIDKGKISMPAVNGKVEFKDLSFNFPRQTNKILNKIIKLTPKPTAKGMIKYNGNGTKYKKNNPTVAVRRCPKKIFLGWANGLSG